MKREKKSCRTEGVGGAEGARKRMGGMRSKCLKMP